MPAIDSLILQINDSIPEIRAATINLLGLLDATEAIEIIASHLNDNGKLESWDKTVSYFAELALHNNYSSPLVR
jgi:hypothetical protein